jgi:hypothetical protein
MKDTEKKKKTIQANRALPIPETRPAPIQMPTTQGLTSVLTIQTPKRNPENSTSPVENETPIQPELIPIRTRQKTLFKNKTITTFNNSREQHWDSVPQNAFYIRQKNS